MIEQKVESKKVWDSAVRIFHWSLVIAFVIAYITGEEEGLIHSYSGYFILGLLVFRIIWGFIGSKHARFSDFIYSPKETISYVKSMMSGTPKHYWGHNPLGALMVFALLITLILTTVSGLKVYGIEGHGPLAEVNSSYFISNANASGSMEQDDEDSEEEEFWEEIHEFFANLMLVLIAFHITGIVISSKLENENLVKAMITGTKKQLK
ncbi:MAG: cytochrome b/b6 domain-containing protein [Gammaproteobacteria bacterium]|nr:cytochrome b/b6 domain-containing protein [Gammaproteobacteria bacterium]